MNKKDKVKSVYKSIVMMFLRTQDDITYWESQKIMEEFPDLFPEINFDELNHEIREELFDKRKCYNPTILGYRYGNSPELHSKIQDYEGEVVVVYDNGTTTCYDYFNGELTKSRG